MEADYGQHFASKNDDVNMLIDDNATSVNSVSKNDSSCSPITILKSNNCWTGVPNSSITNHLTNQMAYVNDEVFDTFEDLPLLISDEDIESVEVLSQNFHCHPNIVILNDNKAWKKLLSASFLCFIFMVAELIGGYIASSLAIMTDAAHLFSDLIGFLMSLLSIWIGRWPRTKLMTFGYHRTEVLGAFLSVLMVWLLAGVFCVLAINRLISNSYNVEANTMLLVSTLGLIINILMGAVLHGYFHAHSHGPNLNHSDENINVRAATAHVLGDLLQSFGVLVAAIIIKVHPEAVAADPICTIFFSVIVVCTTSKVAWDSIWVLLEASPKTYNSIAAELKTLTGVKHLHDLHAWTLAPGKEAVAVHLVVEKSCDKDNILRKATSLIKSKLNIISCTVQVETYNAELIRNCTQCRSFQS